jgi:hypothetical protein
MLALLAATFVAGFFAHFLVQRWSSRPTEPQRLSVVSGDQSVAQPAYPVTYAPLEAPSAPAAASVELPLFQARDVEKIRTAVGREARIRGRIFRVGHSGKSNTYFLNFGPSRSAFTGVIFASAVELFEKSRLSPKIFEGKEVEIQGEVTSHPQYGLEMILESPSQIKILR